MTGTPDPSDAISVLAGYPVTAPPLPRPAVLDQFWGDLTFVHWPVHPDSVTHLYPPGIRPDVFADGRTYVALVPFVMSRSRLGAVLPIPYFGTFPETNIRLYSTDDAGRHGLLFRSLETARLAVVPLTRAGLGIPYAWAKLRTARIDDQVTYHSVRRWPRRGLRSRLTIRVGDVIEPTSLEIWLTARWGVHTRNAGRTWWLPVAHEPWQLRAAEIVELDDNLLDASGVRPAGEHLRALFSQGMPARVGRPAVVR
ncbi:MAG TPA: DUF2071 domain-containing protein [Aldersonia sp.]